MDPDDYLALHANANTMKNELYSLEVYTRVMNQLTEKYGDEYESLQEASAEQLPYLLQKFLQTATKASGQVYSSGSLNTLVCGISSYLKGRQVDPVDVKLDPRFKKVHDMLRVQTRVSASEGRGSGCDSKRPMTQAHLAAALEVGSIGRNAPRPLVTATYFSVVVGMGCRTGTEVHMIQNGDLTFGPLSERTGVPQWIELAERITKTRKGNQGDERELTPRLFPDDEFPETCYVRTVMEYQRRKTPAQLKPDMPFFLTLKQRAVQDPGHYHYWYNHRIMGIHMLQGLLTTALELAGIDCKVEKYSAISLRKSMLQSGVDCEVPDMHLSRLAGHKSLISKRAYIRCPDQAHKASSLAIRRNLYHGSDGGYAKEMKNLNNKVRRPKEGGASSDGSSSRGRGASRERSKERSRGASKERRRSRSRGASRERSRSKSRERRRSRSRGASRERSRSRSRGAIKGRSRSRSNKIGRETGETDKERSWTRPWEDGRERRMSWARKTGKERGSGFVEIVRERRSEAGEPTKEKRWSEAARERRWSEAARERGLSESGKERRWSDAGRESRWSEAGGAGRERSWSDVGDAGMDRRWSSEDGGVGRERRWYEAVQADRVRRWTSAGGTGRERSWSETGEARMNRRRDGTELGIGRWRQSRFRMTGRDRERSRSGPRRDGLGGQEGCRARRESEDWVGDRRRFRGQEGTMTKRASEDWGDVRGDWESKGQGGAQSWKEAAEHRRPYGGLEEDMPRRKSGDREEGQLWWKAGGQEDDWREYGGREEGKSEQKGWKEEGREHSGWEVDRKEYGDWTEGQREYRGSTEGQRNYGGSNEHWRVGSGGSVVDRREYGGFSVDRRECGGWGVDKREYEDFGVDWREYEGFGGEGREEGGREYGIFGEEGREYGDLEEAVREPVSKEGSRTVPESSTEEYLGSDSDELMQSQQALEQAEAKQITAENSCPEEVYQMKMEIRRLKEKISVLEMGKAQQRKEDLPQEEENIALDKDPQVDLYWLLYI